MLAGPRVLFFGMEGELATGALEALQKAGLAIAAVVLPAPAALPGRRPPPIARVEAHTSGWPLASAGAGPSLAALAGQAGIPVYFLAAPGHRRTLDTLAALAPDVGCVACFNRRLPPALLDVPRAGILNLHPAPLPRFRGPAPLFWTFRAGLTDTAVTVHLMDEGLDTGPILGQAQVRLPLGCRGAEADRLCAAAGGPLLATLARTRVAGQVEAQPQPNGPPPDPWPGPDDFWLDREGPAARAFHFMRGTAHWGQPYGLALRDGPIRLREAVGILPDAALGAAAPVVVPQGDELWIRFRPGVLRGVPA